MIRFSRLLVGVLATAALVGPAAMAQEQRTLRFSQPFPANHWEYTESVKRFQEAVTAATGGKIQWQSFHSGQLGKESVPILNGGLADLAIVPPSYEPAKLPLSSVAELPGMYSTSCEATAKFWHIVKDGGRLNDAEYKPLGIKVIYAFVLTPYQVMTTQKKIASIDDIAGLKIRANGSAMDKTIRALGAVPVRVTVAELYDSLTRGTVDGGLWPIGSTRTVSLETTLKNTVVGPLLGSASVVIGMRQKTWDSLSPDAQSVMMKVGAETQKYLCGWLDKSDDDETAWLVKEQNFTVSKLTTAENDRWTQRLLTVGGDWAKEVDATGRPGSTMLKAFKEAPVK
jgi:TRAP-type C4-dicarboxylate transport system substrate-binding protein